MTAATDTQARRKELLEALFSVGSIPRLYNGYHSEISRRMKPGTAVLVTSCSSVSNNTE
jgi:hypothetical protein